MKFAASQGGGEAATRGSMLGGGAEPLNPFSKKTGGKHMTCSASGALRRAAA
jgi:hypothetical protein